MVFPGIQLNVYRQAMFRGTFRGWITWLVGVVLCILVVRIYFHVANPREVHTGTPRGNLKHAVTSTTHVNRSRWAWSIRPSSSMPRKSSMFSERKVFLELRGYNQEETVSSSIARRPFAVDSPVESSPAASSPLFNAADSLQPMSSSIAAAVSASRVHSGLNGFRAWLSSPPLPSSLAVSLTRLSTQPVKLRSLTSAPSSIYNSPSMAQLPPSSSLLRSVPSVASPVPSPASSSYMPATGRPTNGSAESSDSPMGSPLSGCCAENMVIRPGLPLDSCICVYPIRLELLVDNVSTDFKNWSSEIMQELATQLNVEVIQLEINFFQLNGQNLSLVMMIGPLNQNSFSPQQAEMMKTVLNNSKLHLNSSLFGTYKLLQFTYFQSPFPPRFSPLPLLQELPQEAQVYVKDGSVLNLRLLAAVAASAVIVISFLAILLWRYCLPHRTNSHKLKEAELEAPSSLFDVASHDAGSIHWSGSRRVFTFDELRQATNNFEPASVLGEGGIGRVHKGVLKDGTAVAIKRITSESSRGDREFLVEVQMLSRLHHRNLVELLGYYTSRDTSHHCLCYELIPNGSLEAWLHGLVGEHHPLNWETRMKIALDAARGLAYLHEDSQPCVIHRDFKASNILLENDFRAKVADFGLAKQAPKGHLNYVSTRVMGTFGYVAPEYAMTGHLLVKSDVYSYGVVLLELLSGRKPVDMTQPMGQENLVEWARPVLRDMERLGELADPRLDATYPMEDFTLVAFIAAACVAPEAVQRPTMGEVVQSLKMVQRSSDCATSGERNELLAHKKNQSLSTDLQNSPEMSAAFESDGSSSLSSSSHFSGLTKFDNQIFSTTDAFSEDLHEGR